MRRAHLAVPFLSSLGQVGCMGLFCIACDGYLGVEGHVYVWADAPPGTHNKIVIDPGAPSPLNGREPVAECDVTLEPWTPKKRPKPDTATLWTSRAKTNTEGWFKAGGTAKPGWYDATLTVRCGGFPEVQQVFHHDRFRHDVVVTLVRDVPAAP